MKSEVTINQTIKKSPEFPALFRNKTYHYVILALNETKAICVCQNINHLDKAKVGDEIAIYFYNNDWERLPINEQVIIRNT